MKRTFFTMLPLLLAWAAPVWLVGCGSDKDKSTYTLDYQVKKMFGAENTTPAQQAAMAFDANDPDVRRTAIELLSRKKWALRDPYLKRFAQLTRPGIEKDPSVRAVATRALGKARNRKYMPEIIAALDDPSSVVRWDAAVVLQTLPDTQAVTTLQKLAISDESIDVRASAAVALGQYRTSAVYRTLLRCLDDEDFTVRDAAHSSLVVQTGRDEGFDPERWSNNSGPLGRETLPKPVVYYKKRPWWDWAKITRETEAIGQKQDTPGPTSDKEGSARPWWDWFGVK
jgi:HEAT repeat protein